MCVFLLGLYLTSAFGQNADTSTNVEKNQLKIHPYVLAISKDSIVPFLQIYARHSFNQKWAMGAFGEVAPGFGQIYIGPEFSPTKWFCVGAYMGIEVFDPKKFLRIAGAISIATDYFSMDNNIEYGKSGLFYCSYPRTTLMATKKVNLEMGVFARQGLGIGPRVDISLWKKQCTIWLSPLYAGGLLGTSSSNTFTFGGGVFCQW